MHFPEHPAVFRGLGIRPDATALPVLGHRLVDEIPVEIHLAREILRDDDLLRRNRLRLGCRSRFVDDRFLRLRRGDALLAAGIARFREDVLSHRREAVDQGFHLGGQPVDLGVYAGERLLGRGVDERFHLVFRGRLRAEDARDALPDHHESDGKEEADRNRPPVLLAPVLPARACGGCRRCGVGHDRPSSKKVMRLVGMFLVEGKNITPLYSLVYIFL